MRYAGPIIDSHHHLWDLSLGRHPWLAGDLGAMQSLGDISFLRRDYLPADYLADIGPQPVVGSVYIEAVWDRARPVDEEIAWLQSLPRPANTPHGIAARAIAWAPLAQPDVEAALDALGAHPIVVGVRETIRWHPDPAKRWVEAGLLDRADWRRGVALLAARGLSLEVLMNPYQADDVARLARDLPGLQIVVNHCGTPVDRDADGLARWRTGLHRMAAAPNVAIKLSNYGAYSVDKTVPALREVVMTCLDAFGPRRAMFGTDYPVGRRAMDYQDICERFRDIAEDLSDAEQRDLFHDNAARLYRFAATPE
jgi:predicted TIM-barrel fold metal-dependent hydrolase